MLQGRFGRPPKKAVLVGLLVGGVVWFVAMIVLWWTFVYTSPQNVFEGMLARNFATTGYTRLVSNEGQGVKQTEISQVQYGNEPVARSKVTIERGGNTEVAEVLSTTTEDYVRYTELDYKDSEGQAIDMSDAEGVWAKQQSSGSLSQSFSQLTLFGTYFPIGLVPAENRTELLRHIQQNTVYNVDYDNVKTETIDGHRVYTYELTIQLQAYAGLVQRFGEAIGQSARVSGLNPADYAGTEPVSLTVSVDKASRQIVQVAYEQSPGIEERYAGFGIANQPVTLPRDAISTFELQQRLQQQ